MMNVGHHFASWRHPEARAQQILDFDFYRRLAQTAERGKFDLLFLADTLMIDPNLRHRNALELEPLSLLSALSVVTDKIGLAATVSTTYNEPYHIARKFASLDYLSKGRAAWNVVTSLYDGEARNFGEIYHKDHELRYEIAAECLEAVKKLWDTWDEDAFVFDKTSGIFVDTEKVHYGPAYQGKYFSVQGPLNIPRPIQGQPVIIQAGASETGKTFAARSAEVVFTPAYSMEVSQDFYRSVKGMMGNYGRSKDALKILPGIMPIIADTYEEAENKERLFVEMADSSAMVKFASQFIEYDLSVHPLDGPMPNLLNVKAIKGQQGRFALFMERAKREDMTVRQFSAWVAGFRGHYVLKGTPKQVADRMEEWFLNEACDGFNVLPTHFPGGLDDFVQLVIPELQRRGLFKKEYTGGTLREHLGLARPVRSFATSHSNN